ncbi:uncharacterized protein DNG_00882 [Cephalotrichum gorgonifer]|uniref:Uncharacterized protein n=1 Tax=Cephalotrichum gorgonifer TaxID=2041049 RepID=A0AAE8MPW6_9PEZI|nr:uncharacterized protein DNG_00882 [Cephalotrichum gorgonifer]
MPVTSTSPPRANWFLPDHHHLSSKTAATDSNSIYLVVTLLRYTWNGLALFAIFVIGRSIARRISVARRPLNSQATNTEPATPATERDWQPLSPPYRDTPPRPKWKKRPFPLGPSSHPQPRRYLLPPDIPRPFWMMPGRESIDAAEAGDLPPRGGEPHSLPTGSGQPGASAQPMRPGTSSASRESTFQRYVMMRPHRPLTPPAVSQGVFTPEHGAIGADLIHQPNPDYLSSTARFSGPPENKSPSPEAGRRSYSRAIPVPPPLHPRNSDSSGSSDDAPLSPRSYPSPTPFLPPAPPTADEGEESKGVDMQGEVISVTDGFGAGWTRHTRVYGGGVCLACAASGGEGGFYGATALRPAGS